MKIQTKPLLAAVHRLVQFTPRPIQMRAIGGKLHLAVADTGVKVVVTIPTDGDLPLGQMDPKELQRRLKASRSADCELTHDNEHSVVMMQCGSVTHQIPFDPVKAEDTLQISPNGRGVELDGQEWHRLLKVAFSAAAKENTRYAINGVLARCDQKGAGLVGTDGRRMVMVKLDSRPYTALNMLMPGQFCEVVLGLVKTDPSQCALRSGTGGNDKDALFFCGEDWAVEVDISEAGHFPDYSSVIPAHGYKFLLDRRELMDLVEEVAVVCPTDRIGKSVYLDLAAPGATVSAGVGSSQASGRIACEALGDCEMVLTSIDPRFLRDAITTIGTERIVIDVQQNKVDRMSRNRQVTQAPMRTYGYGDKTVEWIIMPTNRCLTASPVTCGHNYVPQAVPTMVVGV